MPRLVPLLVLGMGTYLVGWGVRSLWQARRRLPPHGQVAPDGEVRLAGHVASDVALGPSPVRGVPCAWWHVRVVRIRREVPDHPRVEVVEDVAVTAPTPLLVDTPVGRVRVDPAHVRAAGGAVVVRDQADTTGYLVIAGRTHELPPAPYGTRQVEEGALAPGQPVWLAGRLVAGEGAGTLVGQPDRPVRVDVVAPGRRRAGGAAVALLCLAAGVVLLLVGIAALG